LIVFIDTFTELLYIRALEFLVFFIHRIAA